MRAPVRKPAPSFVTTETAIPRDSLYSLLDSVHNGSRQSQDMASFRPPPPPPLARSSDRGSTVYTDLSRPTSGTSMLDANDPVIHMPVPQTPEQQCSPLLHDDHDLPPTRPPPRPQVPSSFTSNSYDPTTYSVVMPSLPDDYRYDLERQSHGLQLHQNKYTPATYEPPDSRSPSPTVYLGDRSSDDMLPPPAIGRIRDFSKSQLSFYGSTVGGEKSSVAHEARMEKLLANYNQNIQNYHTGPPPTGPQSRRRRKNCRMELTEGNLVIDLPVPSNLRVGWTKGVLDEMKSARYTAVTCDANDFERDRYSLRQNWSGRETELMIAITMYNEDEVLLSRTLYGVMQGIQHLCSRKNSRTWGPEAWKKVVVCIISDGRKNIHPRVLDCLAALGVYQDGVMKSRVKDADVTAHVFEYTTTFALDPDLRFKYPDKGVVPTQIIFCLKEKNAKKINSHRWFFNAFGRLLQPNVCILLDVGTRPGVKSLYHLWKAFDVNSNIGGACGEIAAYKGPYWSSLVNPLVAAQNFEYKMSNILDKPWESICGYISVLPGAFSAYRYIALQNDRNGVGPLASYFKGEVLGGADTDIFTSNMYLAEDRILCFELMAKANADWVLKYVKPAIGETDVPDNLSEFIAQRRRWLNGSLFAAVYALAHLPQVLRSGHGSLRKAVLMFEALFNLVALVFTWFGLANYYLFFVILTSSLEDPVFGIPQIRIFNYFVHFGYGATLASVFIISLGNKPKASKWKYKLGTIFFSVLTIYMIGCAIVCTIRAAQHIETTLFIRMLVSMTSTYGIYLAASILALDPWHMITSFIPYLVLSPMYLNVLTIFAFCNLDDISWGTKEDGKSDDLGTVHEADSESESGIVELEIVAEPADVDTAYLEALNNIKLRKSIPLHADTTPTPAEKEQASKDYYASVRTNVLLCWILSNGLLAVFILSDNTAQQTFSNTTDNSRTRVYMTAILIFVAGTSAVRFIGSTAYLLTRLVTH